MHIENQVILRQQIYCRRNSEKEIINVMCYYSSDPKIFGSVNMNVNKTCII